VLPPYERYPPLACLSIRNASRLIHGLKELTVNTVAVTPEPQVKVELEIPQEPLEDFNVNPDPEGVAV
jgi:hypothetical protein